MSQERIIKNYHNGIISEQEAEALLKQHGHPTLAELFDMAECEPLAE